MAGLSSPYAWTGGGLISLKATNGAVYGIDGVSPDSGFIQVWDLAAAPVLGTNAPKYAWPVIGGQVFHYLFPEGITHSFGIQLGFTRAYAPTPATLIQDALVATVRYS